MIAITRAGRVMPVVLAAILLLGTAPTQAVSPQVGVPEDGLAVAIRAMHQLATDSRNRKPRKTTTKPKPGLPIKLGKDGRLTMLLIGRASCRERV